MSYEQYWDGSPQLVIAYRNAHKLRLEMENEKAWLQGLYVYDAFAVCMANAFAKRGARKKDYIEKPLDIFPLTEQEKKKREKEEYAKMQQAMESMARKQRQQKKQKG